MSKLLIKRKNNQQPIESSELDMAVAKAIYELQSSNADLAPELSILQVYGARQVVLPEGRKALLVMVPVPQLKVWRRIQLKVIRELEKKFSDQTVVFVAYRRIVPPPKRGQRTTVPRPASRTLTAVHENWLEDMVYPTEIIGKRLRYKSDGSRLYRVLLDAKDRTALEGKIDAFTAVYDQLTGKKVVFEFATAVTPAAAIAAAASSGKTA